MPKKKIAHVEEPVKELIFEDEIEEQEEENNRRSGGLDVYDADGELIEAGEPTYIEEEEEEE
jgi:hypothetical protein